jgi:probable HAF family extracellular repeat protein
MRRVLTLTLGFALLAALTPAISGSAARPTERWVVTDLGPCDSIYFCGGPMAINERGQIVGTSGRTAFLWQAGRRVDLGALPQSTESSADAINDRGQVVGTSGRSDVYRPFLWAKGRMRDLGLPGDEGSVEDIDINAHGRVVLTLTGFGVALQGVALWEGGRVRVLKGISEAHAINDEGWIVGDVAVGDEIMGGRRAVLWRKGAITRLRAPGVKGSSATDINERGQVVGRTETPSYAFLWEKGKLARIGPRGAWAEAVNDRGQVLLGASAGSQLLYRLLLWRGGNVTSLGTGVASEMNERGQVVGASEYDLPQPLLWQGGRVTRLPLLPGTRYGGAVALNERDQIVGWSGNIDKGESQGGLYAFTGRVVLWTLKSR